MSKNINFNEDAMVIWKDVPVLARQKLRQAMSIKNYPRYIRKLYKGAWAVFTQDIPVAVVTNNTKQPVQGVDNPRGNAYATRNQQKYRNKKAYNRKKLEKI